MPNRHHARRSVTGLAIAVLTTFTVTGCTSSGSTRSLAAYCKEFYSEGTAFRAGYQSAQNTDMLTQMAKLISAPQELATFFARLDKVAPDDIEPDIAVLQASFQKQSDNLANHAANPLSGLLSGLVDSLSSTGSWQRVNSWTTQNCGPPPGG